MRILHVIDQISQKTGGGSSKVAYELAQAQAALGHDVTIYTTDYNAKNQKAPFCVDLVKFKCRANIGALSIAPGLITAKYDFEILHLHNYRTIVNLLVRKRVPFVIQAHGSCWEIKGRTKALHDYIWGKRLLLRASRCIADAEKEIEHYKREDVDSENIVHIPVGINMQEFRIIPERVQKKEKVILFLGRFHKIKGLDLLFKAMTKINNPDVILVMAGVDYGYQRELQQLAFKLGVRQKIRWVGPLYGAEKIDALTQADLFVMPSYYEMWGLTFMEALACCTPVVMTDTCEASKILPTECGSVVSLDAGHIASSIKALLKVNYVDKHRDYRREWVAQYSWDKIAKQTIKLYEGVIMQKHN